MLDTIKVHGLQVTAYHGVYDEERAEGRRFTIDVEVDVPARKVDGDRLAQTIDYREIARIAVEVLEGPSVHLVETLGEEICRRILAELPSAEGVRLEVRKYATGVPGDPEWVGVAIERIRPQR